MSEPAPAGRAAPVLAAPAALVRPPAAAPPGVMIGHGW